MGLKSGREHGIGVGECRCTVKPMRMSEKLKNELELPSVSVQNLHKSLTASRPLNLMMKVNCRDGDALCQRPVHKLVQELAELKEVA